MTVNTPRPNFSRPAPVSLSGQRLYLREEELDAGVAMILEAATILKAATSSIRAKHALTWTSAQILSALMRAPLGVASLAVNLGITKQAAIKTVEDLEARGLLSRQSDASDGRRKPLSLTSSGQAIARDVTSVLRTLLASAYRQAGGEAVAGSDKVLGALKQAGARAAEAERASLEQGQTL